MTKVMVQSLRNGVRADHGGFPALRVEVKGPVLTVETNNEREDMSQKADILSVSHAKGRGHVHLKHIIPNCRSW